MTSSIGNHNAQQIGRTDIHSMGVEDAFLLVNYQRMSNLGNVLKDQIADVQEKNIQMNETNELMSLARTVLAKFGSDAKSDEEIADSDEMSTFRKECANAGFNTDGISNKGELNAAFENFKSKVDSLTNTQQIAMLHAQSTWHAYNETASSITNHLKGMHDLKREIIHNSV